MELRTAALTLVLIGCGLLAKAQDTLHVYPLVQDKPMPEVLLCDGCRDQQAGSSVLGMSSPFMNGISVSNAKLQVLWQLCQTFTKDSVLKDEPPSEPFYGISYLGQDNTEPLLLDQQTAIVVIKVLDNLVPAPVWQNMLSRLGYKED